MMQGSVILHAVKNLHFTCFLDLELNYTANCRDVATQFLQNERVIKSASLSSSLVHFGEDGDSGNHFIQLHTPENS